MEITVRDIFSLQPLKIDMVLIAGEGGLEKKVSSVSVMEVPDFADKSLTQGLFVLTTLYNFSDNEEQMVGIIRKLAKNNVSGVAIKINRFIEKLPSKVIEEANKYQLPIFYTQKLMFSHMISIITSEIINNEYNKIKMANEQYQEIFMALLNGEKISYFTSKIGKRLNCSCACVSGQGKILAHYFKEGFDRKTLEEELCYEKILGTMLQNSGKKTEISSFLRVGNCSMFPIRVKEMLLGGFLVWSRNDLTEYEILLSQQMKNFLSMKLMEDYIVQADQRRRVSIILDEVLFGRNCKLETIKERLYLIGFKENKAFRVLLFSISEKKINKNKWGMEAFFHDIQTQFPGAVAYFILEGLVMIYPTSDEGTVPHGGNKKLKSYISEAMKRMKLVCKVGCSAGQKDLRKLPECLDQAKQAIIYGSALEVQENIYCYESFSEISAVSYMVGTSGEEEMYRTIIDPIHKYDEEFHQQLWLTLGECLSNNTLEAASKVLHIHSSTLRYRLQNICNITGYDFFTNTGRYVLNTAYILYRITN